jgi:hypothetical protein
MLKKTSGETKGKKAFIFVLIKRYFLCEMVLVRSHTIKIIR